MTKCHSTLILTNTLLSNENSTACYSALLQPIYCLESDWSLLVFSGEEDGWPGSRTVPESWLSVSVAEIKMKNRKRSEFNTNKPQTPNPVFQFALHLVSITFPEVNSQCKITFVNPVYFTTQLIQRCTISRAAALWTEILHFRQQLIVSAMLEEM